MVITSFASDRDEPDEPREDREDTAQPGPSPGDTQPYAPREDEPSSVPSQTMAPIRISAEPLAALPATPRASAAAPRLSSLDALRGLAILLMCLSGLMAKFLPNWMFHGYYPSFLPVEGGGWAAVDNPYQFRGREWPSFTWVDWVFPMFLFAMGAAIPLAMHARRRRGDAWLSIAGHAVGRFFILVGFAVFVQQITAHHMNPTPTLANRWLAILGFLLLLPTLAVTPKSLPRGAVRAMRALGVLAAVVFLAAINDADTNPPFTWNPGTGDVDIIILLLAWSSLAASLLWLVTRGGGYLGWTVRLVVGLGVAFVAHHQGMDAGWRLFGEKFDAIMPWVHDAPRRWLDLRWLNTALPGHLPDGLLDLSPLYDFTWLKFLWVVVPGTVIGDLVARHLQDQRDLARVPRPAPDAAKARLGVGQLWGLGRHVVITAALLATMLAVLYGLKDYATSVTLVGGLTLDTPYAALLLGLPPLVLALIAMLGKPGPSGRYLRRLTLWGTAWLTAGLMLAVLPNLVAVPAEQAGFHGAGYFEFGISKGPPARLSWYLVSLGLSILLLAVLAVWIDVRGWRWPFGLLIANGQNPMLAYAAVHAVLGAVVALPLLLAFVPDGVPATPDGFAAHWITQCYGPDASLWHDFGWDLAKTLGLAAAVWAATRARLVLRS